MLATEPLISSRITLPVQALGSDERAAAVAPCHLEVIRGALPGSPIEAPPSGRGARRKRGQGKKKRGGWSAYKGMTLKQRKDIRRFHGLAWHEGYRLNVFVSINLPVVAGESDAARKRRHTTAFTRLGEALTRIGHDHIAVTVYEKPVGGRLHGHQLLHVRPEAVAVVARIMANLGGEFAPGRSYRAGDRGLPAFATWADSAAVPYITKERLPAHPDYEQPGRRTGERFRGQRVSFTKFAKALLAGHGADVRSAKAQKREAVKLSRLARAIAAASRRGAAAPTAATFSNAIANLQAAIGRAVSRNSDA